MACSQWRVIRRKSLVAPKSSSKKSSESRKKTLKSKVLNFRSRKRLPSAESKTSGAFSNDLTQMATATSTRSSLGVLSQSWAWTSTKTTWGSWSESLTRTKMDASTTRNLKPCSTQSVKRSNRKTTRMGNLCPAMTKWPRKRRHQIRMADCPAWKNKWMMGLRSKTTIEALI